MNIDFKNNYISWVKENTYQHKINDNLFRFTLPFLDRHNDQIEVYIREDGSKFTIFDDGFTISDLAMSGMDVFSSNKREQLFYQILDSHGVEIDKSNMSLFVTGRSSDLPLRKHMLAQCIQKISDMFYLSQSHTQSFFLEDVQILLDKNDIRYSKNISLTGKSKLPINFDFIIPKSNQAPERVIKVVNSLGSNNVKNILFCWQDVIPYRVEDTKLFTIIDDRNKVPSTQAIDALTHYDVVPVFFSKSNDFIPQLCA